MKRVLANGTFDMLHYGHINYLKKAKSYGDYLVVLVCSDNLSYQKKGRKPFFDENIRSKVISSLKCVDEVILRYDDFSEELIKSLGVDVFVTVYPESKKFENIVDVVVLEETKGISSTKMKEYLNNIN